MAWQSWKPEEKKKHTLFWGDFLLSLGDWGNWGIGELGELGGCHLVVEAEIQPRYSLDPMMTGVTRNSGTSYG